PTDGLAALAAAAKETRGIELGIGVIPLHTRGPASIVEGVRAQALPLDRLLLGVGSPNPGALARVRGGIAELRSRLGSASRGGSSGEASGEMVRWPRLVIAALGPKMCRLAGEVGDGVLLNWVSPEHARRSVEIVREGAVAAKRP